MQLTPSHEVNSPSRVAALEDIIECVAPQLLQLVGVARSRLRIYSASAYLKVTNRASIYARVHLNRAVAVRYASAPLQPSFAGGAIGVVISNVDLDVELQGLGFLARLEAAIWSIPGVGPRSERSQASCITEMSAWNIRLAGGCRPGLDKNLAC